MPDDDPNAGRPERPRVPGSTSQRAQEYLSAGSAETPIYLDTHGGALVFGGVAYPSSSRTYAQSEQLRDELGRFTSAVTASGLRVVASTRTSAG